MKKLLLFFIQNEFQKLNQNLLETSNFRKFGSHHFLEKNMALSLIPILIEYIFGFHIFDYTIITN